jgi:hypothetical protein
VKDPQSTSDDEIPVTYGPEYWAHFLDDLDEDDYGGDRPHLISVDELRAAGALDVPAAWRKSLGEERRYLLPGFEDDEDAESELGAQIDSELDEPAN